MRHAWIDGPFGSEGAYLPETIPHPLTSRSGPYHLEMSLAAI